MSYRLAVQHQINRIMRHSRIGNAVIDAIKGLINVRPGKHARVPAAHWDPEDWTVYYAPGHFIETSHLYAASPYFIGYSPDTVLLHELVHAMRSSRRFRMVDQQEIPKILYLPWADASHVTSHLFFGKRGEFNAIVIANTYLSEINPGASLEGMARNHLYLAKDHHEGHIHLPLANPADFHKNSRVKRLLRMLWNEQPDLCERIAAVPARFNPLRDVDKSSAI
jgi:hypothetical protein